MELRNRGALVACLVIGLGACSSADHDGAAEPPAPPPAPAPQATGGGAMPTADAATVVDPTRDGGRPPPRDEDAASVAPPADGGELGAFDAAVSASPSHGGTITFQGIGAAGWFPSRRDPASGECSAYRNGSCCMTRHEISDDALTPWDEDLIMTLRGPMVVAQIGVYQPMRSGEPAWSRVADWDARSAQSARGLAFDGDATRMAAFAGTVGDQCLVDVMSDREFPCGPGSTPYCPAPASGRFAGHGWSGSKLVVLLVSMPHDGDGAIAASQDCSDDATDNWHDAPWIGFSHGELVRAGKFGDCHCYAKDPMQWWLGDGCGQFNAFEVVNDNNQAMNLDVFSTNFFGYQGYIGEGPCGGQCDTSALAPEVDLIDKASSGEAARGAIATPEGGPGAAFRRPSTEPRYFIILFDVGARAVQLAIISPQRIPEAAAALLPDLPDRVESSAISALADLRLPR